MNDISIEVSVDDQTLKLMSGSDVVKQWPVSTAAKGVGFQEGSYRTPTGNFVISEKIGDDSAPGTIFKGRKVDGEWDGDTCSCDLILTRILWLDGTDEENANSHDRFIYIHGTNHEDQLGSPASCGCIRMSNLDIIELYDMVPTMTPVKILPPEIKRGKLIFFDCDSTLSTIEGIDELARACGDEVFHEVEAMTNAAMNGELPIHEVFPRRMEIIRPSKDVADAIAQKYIDTMTPGIKEFIDKLKSEGWTPVVLSGGFAPLIEPLAQHLGIKHVEAVPLYFNEDGSYTGYGEDYATTRNGGKPEVIREWKDAMLPEHVIMVGDGISDLESRSETDLFIGYGGVVERSAVKAKADIWITSFDQIEVSSLI